MNPWFVTAEFVRAAHRAIARALRPIRGERGIRVVDGPRGVSIGLAVGDQTGIGGGGQAAQPRAVVTGRTSDDLRFTGKLLDSRGQPLKDEDGADLPAVEIWVDTWPPGTPIGDCLQQWEVGHEIPVRYHLKYDEATELDVRRPYVDDVLLSIKCDGGGGGR